VDVLRMVRQCIGMTGSSNQAEAASMALKACHAILKHGLVVSFPEDVKAPAPETPASHPDPFSPPIPRPTPPPAAARPVAPPRPSKPKKPWRGSDPFVDETQGPPAPRSTRTSRKSGGASPKPKHWDRGERPVKLTNKYAAFCKGCGARCEVGSTIYWRKEQGICCVACGPKPLEG
jgi:hypothetical protein